MGYFKIFPYVYLKEYAKLKCKTCYDILHADDRNMKLVLA